MTLNSAVAITLEVSACSSSVRYHGELPECRIYTSRARPQSHHSGYIFLANRIDAHQLEQFARMIGHLLYKRHEDVLPEQQRER